MYLLTSRLNLNLGGGAWCPVSARPESSGEYEFLEINFINITVFTALSMQGRWNYGFGREFVSKFRLEYTTDGLNGSWIKYRDQNLETVSVRTMHLVRIVIFSQILVALLFMFNYRNFFIQ